MNYDERLVGAKLKRWKSYVNSYSLPKWEDIPDLGLYMEQVIALLGRYLDYLPPELIEEQHVTTAAINNYVRMRIIPPPVKKRYYRIHLAYLLIICTLKQTLSISLINRYLPATLSEEEVHERYTNFRDRHEEVSEYFLRETEKMSANLLGRRDDEPMAVKDTVDLISGAAILGTMSRLLSEKLILLDGKKYEEMTDEELKVL